MTDAVDVALVLVADGQRRAVRATLTADATVGQLADALGCTAPLYRHEQRLDFAARLVDTGVVSGDELGVGAPVAVDWQQLRPELRVIGGLGAGLRLRLRGRPVVVGRGLDADVVVPGASVSRAHAEVRLEGDGFTVRDLGSRNGVRVDGVPLESGAAVAAPFGSVVRIGDSLLTVAPAPTGATTLRRADAFHFAFEGGRPPRPPERPVVEPGAPVAAAAAPRRSIVPFLVPTAGALALAASASGAPPALAFAATPVAVAAALVAERGLQSRDARRARARADTSTRAAAAAERVALLAYAQSARAVTPDPAALLSLVEHRQPLLWSTATADVSLRVGLLAEGDAWVPFGVPLRNEPVVVAGPDALLDAVVTWLAVQTAALVSPRELDVVVVSDRVERWAWTAWLPHRAAATVVPVDTEPHRMPARRARRRLVVLDEATSPRWRGDPALSDDDVVVWRVANEHDVGFRASSVISAAGPAHLRVENAEGVRDDVLADALASPDEYAVQVALALARLQSPFGANRVSGPTPLSDVVAGLDSVDALTRRWRHATGPLQAVVGSDASGLLELSLEGQNSHALIAGTTGSGKTRLLESLVVSLAASRSPAELNVLIVDFKGGNELAALTALPHCVGLVSDRDPAEVDRAVSALTREIARRDDLFARAGASDLVDYAAKTGAGVPRLVVIADEFGQFRRDDTLGGRVATLLRIAAQGRSKGIHLVLATQSPSTDVTAEIRQNVGIRVCLRVAEPGESVAVLGVPDASRLPGPGHVLIAVDNEVRAGRVATLQTPVEEVPDACVVDLVDAARGVVATEPAGRRLLDVALDTISRAATAIGARAPVLLAPPLPAGVARRELRHARRPWSVGGLVIGARDRPGIAEPAPFCFDPARDVCLTVVGGARSGRTTALLSAAEAARDQADPKAPIVVHSIAWASGLEAIEGAPGDGGVVRRGDFDHLRRTIHWLAREPTDATTRLVLVDRLDLLLRDLRDLDGGSLAAQFVEILQDGPRRRLAAVVTVDPAALVAASATLSGPRLVLPISDATVAMAAGVVARPDAPAGRGVLDNGDTVQVGLPADAPNADTAREDRVEPMPSVVPFATLRAAEGERVTIGFGGADRLGPLVVDLDAVGPIVVVVGRAGSGRSGALRAFAAGYRGDRRIVEQPDALPDQPSLLLVDDAVRAAGTRPWLDADDFPDVLRRGGHVAVVAYEQADLTGLGYRHWLTKRTYPGLLLSLDATPDRIVAGERLGFLPPAELRAGPAGRGWWCWRGTGVPVQVAAAPPA